jgi:hypothetical protein
MTANACKPVTTLPSPKSGAMSWKTFVRACGYGVSACANPDAFCAAKAEPPPGFSQCIYQPGQYECPAGYPDRRIFYNEVSDSRHCSECACGAPEGGVCSIYLRAYQDAFCTVLAAGSTIQLTASCSDLLDNTGLGSKMVLAAPTYEPGTCEPSGGELAGSFELKGPTTFCCL